MTAPTVDYVVDSTDDVAVFETRDEALEYARELLDEARDAARAEGAWCSTVDDILVYERKVVAWMSPVTNTDGGIDYELGEAKS